MGRKHGSRFVPKPRGKLTANREVTAEKSVLSISRRVNPDDWSKIGAAIELLHDDETVPPLKSHLTKRDVFILDPRLLPKNLAAGFITGMQFERFLNSAEGVLLGEEDDGCPVRLRLDQARLLGVGRKTVLCPVESEQLQLERAEVYRLLGIAGVKGLPTARGSSRKPETILMPVCSFEDPISMAREDFLVAAVAEAVSLRLGAVYNPTISLGAIETPTIRQARGR